MSFLKRLETAGKKNKYKQAVLLSQYACNCNNMTLKTRVNYPKKKKKIVK